MAKKDILKQLEMIDALENRMKSILDDFLNIPPRQFVQYKRIGETTSYQVREAIESLGIVWGDAT